MHRFFLILLLLFGCNNMNDDRYRAHDVTIVDYHANEEQVTIDYNVPLESLFTSPGIYLHNEDGDITLSFSRCKINDSCLVDIKSTVTSGHYRVVIPRPEVNLYWEGQLLVPAPTRSSKSAARRT